MAVKTFERVVDDLDGTELAPMSVESVTFGIDGETFDIDLSTTNAAMLRDIFAPYAAAARVVSIGDREVGAYTRTVLPSAHAGTNRSAAGRGKRLRRVAARIHLEDRARGVREPQRLRLGGITHMAHD